MKLIIAISGPTCSGKSTLAKEISSTYNIPVIHQDKFYKKDSEIELKNDFINYDSIQAISVEDLVVETMKHQSCLVEGSMIFEIFENASFDIVKVWIDLDYETIKTRRRSRLYQTDLGLIPDEESYFDEIVWPQHLIYASKFKENPLSSHDAKLYIKDLLS